MKKEFSMRKEYDMSGGVRGKFFGKVATSNPIVEPDDSPLDETIEDALEILESNLGRIGDLRTRLAELDAPTQERLSKRIQNASARLDEIALSK